MYRSNPDENLRKLERNYSIFPSPQTLFALNSAKKRVGLPIELGIEHLQYLAEGVADLIGATRYDHLETVTWNGTYQGIDIHINARRLYGSQEDAPPFLQIGRSLAIWEIPSHPMVELYADSEPMNINFGKEQAYFQLDPHQPWVYDPQSFLDYLMELNKKMEESEWYQKWAELHQPWLKNPKKIKKVFKTKKRRPPRIVKHFQHPSSPEPQYSPEELLKLKEEYYRHGQHLLYPEFDFGCKECGSEWKHRYFCSKEPKSGFRKNPMKNMNLIDTFDPEKPFIHENICFDPKSGSGAVGNTSNINYMGFVVFMKPEDFLKLCLSVEDHPRESLDFFVSNIPDQKHCIGPSMLYLSKKESDADLTKWRVSGHEGRHRAMALKELGLSLIPVYCIPTYYRARDINKEFLDKLYYIETERGVLNFFEPEIIIIDKKVYFMSSEKGDRLLKTIKKSGWEKPISIETVEQLTPMPHPHEDYNYFWSKPRPNPGRHLFLTPEEADQEINEKALPIFHDFRHRESDYIWYRSGNLDEFSEFTFCPVKLIDPNAYRAPQMEGGRDTGIATGQYAYCNPRPKTRPLVGPRNPFIVTHKEKGENPAYRFARLARIMLRLAETVSGEHDWTQKGSFGSTGLTIGPFPIYSLEITMADPLTLTLEFKSNGLNALPNYDILGEQIIKAILDWEIFKQVHPLNILLSRLGFDGVAWAGNALEYGDCGDYGCLLFPPISYEGEVIGLNPTKGKFMRLP